MSAAKIKNGFAIKFGSKDVNGPDLWLHVETSARKAKGLLDVQFVPSDSLQRPTLYASYSEAVNVSRALNAVLDATNPTNNVRPDLTPVRMFL